MFFVIRVKRAFSGSVKVFKSSLLTPVVWLVCAGGKTNFVPFNKVGLSSEGKPARIDANIHIFLNAFLV